jgi:hypothetical protein
MSTGSIPVPVGGAVGAVPPTVDVYGNYTDLNQVLTPEQQEELKQNTLTSFSTGLSVFLSLITFSLFSTIYYLLKHDQMPKVKADDPSAGKAIGFLFIPIYGLIWAFTAWPRLIDRINFQYRLRGQAPPIDRGKVITTLILALVGWVFIIGWLAAFVFWIMMIVQTQSAINNLAAERGA